MVLQPRADSRLKASASLPPFGLHLQDDSWELLAGTYWSKIGAVHNPRKPAITFLIAHGTGVESRRGFLIHSGAGSSQCSRRNTGARTPCAVAIICCAHTSSGVDQCHCREQWHAAVLSAEGQGNRPVLVLSHSLVRICPCGLPRCPRCSIIFASCATTLADTALPRSRRETTPSSSLPTMPSAWWMPCKLTASPSADFPWEA